MAKVVWRVTEPGTNNPVVGATVYAKTDPGGAPLANVNTAADGTATFQADGQWGDYYLEVTHNGTTQRHHSRTTGVTATIPMGELALLLEHMRDGVVKGSLNELAVTADGGGMDVQVATGYAGVRGHPYVRYTAGELPVTAADATNPRIDRVIVRLTRATGKMEQLVKPGTPAATPTPPTLTQSSVTWEISLAQVMVSAGVTVIAADKVTDEREWVSGRIVVKEGNALVAVVTDLDFDATDFNVTTPATDRALVGLNYGTGAGQPAEGNDSRFHSAVTVTDTASVDLTLAGQAISAVVLPAGVAHQSLSGAGTNTHAQIDTHITTAAAHIASTSNPHGVTKAQVGLGSVDNTSDAAKPISTATQTALNAKANDTGDTFTGPVVVNADGNPAFNVVRGTTNVLFVKTSAGTEEVAISNGADLNFFSDNSFALLKAAIDAATGNASFNNVTVGGDLDHNGGNAGFYGAAPVAKPTVTGSRGGNAALDSLLTALATLGLITNSSS